MDSSGGEHTLICIDCGAAVRAIDNYCSQCGRRDPAAREDAELNAPTLVAPDPPADDRPYPTFIAPSGGTFLARLQSAAPKRDALALQQLLRPGSVFARRYRIQRFLGAGAMGYVCSAVDESIDELVALKILSVPIQDEPDAFERFKQELKLARRIRHRNVVQSFDLGFADGYPFISMEYIDADNLLKHLHRRSSFDEESSLAVLRQVLRGLRAAHDLGIVHRDIKPENILLNKDDLAFITDFGIATSPSLALRRELAGTPDYMAPEQLRMEEVTPASDLYACGVLLYRMISGRLPYRADSVTQIIDAHLNQPPQPIPDTVSISPQTRELLDWMLQKDVRERPQQATPLLEKIDILLKSGTTSRSGARRPTVVVVEQDAETVSVLRGALEQEGFRVVSSTNARDGVNLAFEQAPVMIFLDAKIRGGFEPAADLDQQQLADGLGFVRILRADEKLRRCPVILITDKTLSQFNRRFGTDEVADVLLKPFTHTDVVEAIQSVRPSAAS